MDNNTEVEYVNGEKKSCQSVIPQTIQAGEEEVGLISNFCDVRLCARGTPHYRPPYGACVTLKLAPSRVMGLIKPANQK